MTFLALCRRRSSRRRALRRLAALFDDPATLATLVEMIHAHRSALADYAKLTGGR